MKKSMFAVVLCVMFLVLFAGCKKEPAEQSETTAGKETSEAKSYELFEKYRESAKASAPYEGQPGKGKKLGFANIYGTQPFCISVEQDIIKQAKLAGFAEEDLIILDNQYNAVLGLKNADIMLSKRPDIFIEFQADGKVNHIIAQKFKAAGIPIIAVDVPIPGAPFMGINNWKVSTMGGKEMARLIKEQWGGWDAVDMITLLQFPSGGEENLQRSEGFAEALVEEFGEKAEEKIVRTDGGMGQSEQAKSAMDDVLASHPNAKKIAVASINEQTMAGIIASLQGAGRWNDNDIIVVTLGVDELGQSQLRDGTADVGIAFFPEKYGEYLVSAACAILQGGDVPENIYVENEVITLENIDQYYPAK